MQDVKKDRAGQRASEEKSLSSLLKREEEKEEKKASEIKDTASASDGSLGSSTPRTHESWEVVRLDGSWICKACTFVNSKRNERCSACFGKPKIRVFELPLTCDVLRLHSARLGIRHGLPLPKIKDDFDALVRIEYVMVHSRDIELMRSGLDYTPGQYATGVIVKMGSRVRRIRVGQKVCVLQREKLADSEIAWFGTGKGTKAGGCSQYIVRKQNQLRLLPRGIDLKDGCLLPFLYTASEAVESLTQVKSEVNLTKLDNILVMGCHCLGLFALSLLAPLVKKADARLLAFDLDPCLEAKAKEYGAHEFIAANSMDSLHSGIAAALDAPHLTVPRTVTRILDTTGVNQLISEMVKIIGFSGLIVLSYPHSRGKVALDLGLLHSNRVSLKTTAPFIARPRALRAADNVGLKLSTAVDQCFPLSRFALAFGAAVQDEVLIKVQE